MAIRKVNKTLCGLLGIAVIVAFIGYYFAMSNELTLNKLSRQITTLNDENAELQNQLDRLKSFNNVDSKMMQYNMLQKAAKVIEVQAVHSPVTVDKKSGKKQLHLTGLLVINLMENIILYAIPFILFFVLVSIQLISTKTERQSY